LCRLHHLDWSARIIDDRLDIVLFTAHHHHQIICIAKLLEQRSRHKMTATMVAGQERLPVVDKFLFSPKA
jgi:hypothetical protein